MEIHDGDGIRTTVFFKGCPLKCIWCHNPESISRKPEVAFFKEKCISCGACGGRGADFLHSDAHKNCPTEALKLYGIEYDSDELLKIVEKDAPFFKNSGGGVTFSGGECLMQADFAVELAEKLKKRGIGVFIDTCGFAPRSAFERILPYADAFLYDVKAIDSEVHKRLTARENELILENLRFLSQAGATLEIRIPLVKGCNDGQIPLIGEFLKPLSGIRGVKVLRYHNFAASRYEALGMENTLPPSITSDGDVVNAVEELKKFGLRAFK